MKLLQRIVNAFAARSLAEREAGEENPVLSEFVQSGPGVPGGCPESHAEAGLSRETAMEPSDAAQRLWCTAGHF